MVVKSDLHYSFIDGGPLEDSLPRNEDELGAAISSSGFVTPHVSNYNGRSLK